MYIAPYYLFMCNTSEETPNGIILIKPTEHKKSLSSDTEQLSAQVDFILQFPLKIITL